MVFGWLFGDKKKQDDRGVDLSSLFAETDQVTNALDAVRGEALCRDLLRLAPDNADAWNMMGVNLIRKGMTDSELRVQAVMAWMRALALRPGDARAADHLRTEIQFPEELVPGLVHHLGDAPPAGEDAAGALAQIGQKARPALDAAARSEGAAAERARAVLLNLP